MDSTLLNVAALALLGFIVGWGLEFALDFLYWRRRAGRVVEASAEDVSTAQMAATPNGSGDEMLRLALAERDEALLQARRQAAQRGEELARAELALKDYEATAVHLKQQLEARQAELARLRESLPADELAARDVEIATLQAQLNSAQSAVAELTRQVEQRTADLESLRAQLAASVRSDEFETLRGELAAREAELGQVRAELEARQQEAAEVEGYLQEREAEVKRLREVLGETSAELDHLRQRELDRLVIEETEYIHEDDLTDIKGVGEVYAEKLREAGYYTYHHLADAEVDELKSVLNIPNWRTPNLQGWIDQARALAEQKEAEEE